MLDNFCFKIVSRKTLKNVMQFIGSILPNIRLRQAEGGILVAAEEVAGQDIHMMHIVWGQAICHCGNILF